MGTSLLDLCRDAAVEMGLTRPAALFPAAGNEGDENDQKLLRAATKAARHIATRRDWQVLRAERVYTTIAAERQTTALPSDFLRIVQDTMINRSVQLPMKGPVSASRWASLRLNATPSSAGSFRIMANSLDILPAPSAGQTLSFEYVRNWIGTAAGAGIAKFAADTNECLWTDETMIAGMVWCFREAEQLESQMAKLHFERRLLVEIAADGDRGVTNMTMAGVVDEVAAKKANIGRIGVVVEQVDSGYSVP